MVLLTSAQTKKLPLILQPFYRPSLLQTAKEEDGNSVKSGRGRFQVLKSGISNLITFHLNYFQHFGICQDQSASVKQKELTSPEPCEKNRKLVCTRKQWRPQLGCCNGGNCIRTGQERTILTPQGVTARHRAVMHSTSGKPHTVTK